MGSLAEVIQQKGREDEIEPGPVDRLAAKMAHIGIERFGTGHRQHHGAEQHESLPGVAVEKLRPPGRIQCPQGFGVEKQLIGAGRSQCCEPHGRDWSEIATNCPGPALLHGEQAEQQKHGEWQHIGR